MWNINAGTTDEKTLLDALRGEYGGETQKNGIVFVKSGRVMHMWGTFDSGTEVIEVPRIPVRYPLQFSSETKTVGAIVEANSGFVKVPVSISNERFIVMGFSLLNT